MFSDSPLLASPLLAFVLTACGLQCARWLFPRVGLLDFPARYGLKRAPLPYPAGIVGVVAFLLLLLIFFPLSSAKILSIVCAVLVVSISAFFDDRYGLPAYARLILQAAAGLLIYGLGDCTGGRICSITNPLDGILGPDTIDIFSTVPIVSAGITIFWIMLTTNALNWFDGIPGQTSIISVIGFCTIGFLSLSDRVDQPELALMSFLLAGIAFATFLFTMPKPLMILGDSGSMFFGLMLGILTVISGGKVATAFLVLGVPIIDLFFVIIRRISKGKSPFKGSMSGEHLHHLLLARGWNEWHIILLTTIIGSLFGISALFLSTPQKVLSAAVLFLLMIGLKFVIGKKAKS